MRASVTYTRNLGEDNPIGGRRISSVGTQHLEDRLLGPFLLAREQSLVINGHVLNGLVTK